MNYLVLVGQKQTLYAYNEKPVHRQVKRRKIDFHRFYLLDKNPPVY